MARPRNQRPSQRLTLTLNADQAERLDAFARSIGRAQATAASRLLDAALQREQHDPCADQLATATETIHRLEGVVHKLEQREAAREGTEASRPAWERGLETLLADEGLWSWLPELNALLGRDHKLSSSGTSGRPLDDRGYLDLLGTLFPPIVPEDGPTTTWNCPRYGHAALLAWRNRERRTEGDRPVRSEVWEPVIRHVAKALALLESCSTPNTEPYLRIRADAEIRTEWLRTLAGLVGEDKNLLREVLPMTALA